MSNIILNTYAQKYTETKTTEFLKRYNTEAQDLTQEGRRSLLHDLIFFAFLEGFRVNDTMPKIKFTDKEKAIIKYCEPSEKWMWAAEIMGTILECDFKDALSTLRELRGNGVDI